jgi:hypothetical protein
VARLACSGEAFNLVYRLEDGTLGRGDIRSLDMDQRNIVKTAETLMDQVNMIAIKSGRDDNDTRAT